MSTEVIFEIQQGPYWDWRVALDLFLGGAGAGALVFAIYLDEIHNGKHRHVCNTAAWLSPILIAGGLLLLMSKMGRPFDIFLSYTNFNPLAPLWWGGIIQPLLVLGSLLYAIKWHHPAPQEFGRKWLGRLLAPLAVIVGAYHGFLLSVMVSRPLWNTGSTVVTALLGFVSTGIAIVMLAHLVRMKLGGHDDADRLAHLLSDIRDVRTILGVVLALQLGTLFLWWQSLIMGSLQDQEALAVANDLYGALFWLVGIGLGVVIPLLLGFSNIIFRKTNHLRFEITMIGLSSILILVGGYVFRLSVLLAGQGAMPFTIDL